MAKWKDGRKYDAMIKRVEKSKKIGIFLNKYYFQIII
jgi:hypothetical protein